MIIWYGFCSLLKSVWVFTLTLFGPWWRTKCILVYVSLFVKVVLSFILSINVFLFQLIKVILVNNLIRHQKTLTNPKTIDSISNYHSILKCNSLTYITFTSSENVNIVETQDVIVISWKHGRVVCLFPCRVVSNL